MKVGLAALAASAHAQDLFLAMKVEVEVPLQVPMGPVTQQPFRFQPVENGPPLVAPRARALPTVTAHGMGDSCFNAGFQGLTTLIATQTKQYAVCIPTGDDQGSDTNNGFFMDMDTNVEVFARKIRADPKLSKGFHCVGLSQGNSLCRGYIHKYNDPPVSTFLSIHGTVAGVAGFPHCNPDGLLGPVCKPLAELLGEFAFSPLVQHHLFQAGYFRDPQRIDTEAYKKNSQIAQWNNEGLEANATFKENFGKVKKFAMIKAEEDTMLYPNEGEWWGGFADGSLDKVLPMKETSLYKNDNFGLKTADEAGKIAFDTTKGDHLHFSDAELAKWIDEYYTE